MNRFAILAVAAAFSSAAFGWQDPNIYVPETSVANPADAGLRAHTNHLIFTGIWNPGGEPEPVVATHGPALLGMYQGVPGYHPAQILRFYNMPAGGGSNAIAIVDAYHYHSSLHDFNYFSTHFGLPTEPSTHMAASTNTVFQVVYAGGARPAENAGWGQEAALDIEWAHSMAPNAKIYLVEADSNSYADLLAAIKKAASLPNVREVSMSFGGGEFSSEASYDSYFQHQNVVYFASTGDSGGVKEWPSVSVNVVGVGGTHLVSRTDESAWAGSGCGYSAYEPIQTWQSPVLLGSFRATSDVSADADPYTGCAVYDSTPSGGYSGWMVFGGTSLACPLVAGMTNTSAHFLVHSKQEQIRLYGEIGTTNLFDPIAGTAGSYTAGVGYDLPTGVGAPRGTNAL